jgi:hypothetical protein
LPRENTNATCSDGQDNDKDGLVDCAEKPCQGEGIVVCNGSTPVNPLPAQSEWAALTTAECSNGTDDDAPPNGFIDCKDYGCSYSPDMTTLSRGQ